MKLNFYNRAFVISSLINNSQWFLLYTTPNQSIVKSLLATMQIYLKTIIGPRTKLEHTGLLVKWEVLDVDFARGLINRRWLPLDQSLMVDCGLRGQGHLEVSVRAASEHISGSGRCGGLSLLCTYDSISKAHDFFFTFNFSFLLLFIQLQSICTFLFFFLLLYIDILFYFHWNNSFLLWQKL